METQLYPGIAFSPPAALTDNIGAGDTIIPVSDTGLFPPAPNLATIGADEDGETILYAAKTATSLSGCTRGVEGTARAWSAGEPIARNWTAKDHADLIAAVEEAREASDPAGTAAAALRGHQEDTAAHGMLFAAKQDKLTGQPGQTVGFGKDGSAVAVPGWSNPNLLDNWYFRDPVNQRGQENYVDTRYTVDRWCHSRSTISIEEDGIGILWDGTGANGLCYEYIPINQIEPGQKYTFSALVKDLGLICVTASALSAPPPAYTTLAFSPNAEVRLELSEGSTNGNQWMQCSIRTYTTEKWVIKAVKLELGAQQTLAHQDAEGSWVLNDPPPNKALELAKCQRYQYIANAVGNNIAHFGQGTTDSSNSCVVIAMPIPEMRAFPAISSVGNFELSSAEDDHLPVTGISVYISSQSGFIWLMVKASGTLTKGRLYRLCAKSDKTARVILDANL